MLIRASEIRGSIVEGTDGQLGIVDDLYFDAYRWLVDYLVIDMGTWFDEQEALLPPSHIETVDWPSHRILVRTSRDGLRHGPQPSQHHTVARQMAERNAGYVWWPPAVEPNVEGTAPGPIGDPFASETDQQGRPLMRSVEEVTGYVVEAIDGRCGRLLNLLVDDRSWRIMALIIDHHNWLPGPGVIVPVDFVEHFDWLAHTVHMTVTRDRIRSCKVYGEE